VSGPAANDLRFDDRVALVDTSAMGVLAGRSLSARGARVSVVGHPGGAADPASVAAELAGHGGTVLVCPDDPTLPEGAAAAVAETLAALGRLDVLVASAEAGPARAFGTARPDEIRSSLRSELLSACWLLRAAWAGFRERRCGRVVLGLPQTTLDGAAGHAVDGAMATGLLGLVNVLEIEGRRHDLAVNLVAVDDSASGLLADVVVYLAHDRCRLSGEVFSFDDSGVRRVVVGVGGGIYLADPGVDDIVDRLDEILSFGELVVPRDASGELPLLTRHLGRRQG
jgi:NAD(P)-dependent dehydrogenase (short-subunit alcohol dehydrogenase family)